VRAASAAALAVGVLLLSACGRSQPPHRRIHLTAFEQRGKALFIRTCGTCHTLPNAGTSGIAGPPLDQPWAASRVREIVADGPGQMPAGLLGGRAADAVAAYVAAATNG
jgi:mono/diheme cytochrome c family protein